MTIPEPLPSDLQRDAEADYELHKDAETFTERSAPAWIRLRERERKLRIDAERQRDEARTAFLKAYRFITDDHSEIDWSTPTLANHITGPFVLLQRRAEEAERQLAFLKSKGLTVGTLKESGKQPRLSYHIESGSELCDLKTLDKLMEAERQRDSAIRLNEQMTAEKLRRRDFGTAHCLYCGFTGIRKPMAEATAETLEHGRTCDKHPMRKIETDRDELAKRLATLTEAIRYWSYCTWSGIRKECPELQNEFRDLCKSLGISPYGNAAPDAKG